MNILKEINENDTMEDMCKNILQNIIFYVEHREQLADMHLSNEYLLKYAGKLKHVLNLYQENTVPTWFKNYNAYLFVSNGFPYTSPYLQWLLSFEEWIDILIQGGIIQKTNKIGTPCQQIIVLNDTIYTVEEWRKKYKKQ